MATSKEKYNFGEKEEEYSVKDQDMLPVWQSPKYKESKAKAIEMIESKKYGLTEADFWILMNRTSSKKMAYTGLIISHNGCLKINDASDNKVNPKCFTIDKDGYNNSLVYTYIDDDTYEVGEFSATNGKNAYPYAMAYKRCFDRVVLKKSKLAYSGIYSEVEADEFRKSIDEGNEIPNNNKNKTSKADSKDDFILGEPADIKLSDKARQKYYEQIWKYEEKNDLKSMYDHYKVDDVQKLNDKDLKEALACLIKRYGEMKDE